MATNKKVTVRPKRKTPKRPVQKKEEIEKHLKAINAALGIEETETPAELPVVTESSQPSEVAHASDLIGGTVNPSPSESTPENPVQPTETATPDANSQPTSSEPTVSATPEPTISSPMPTMDSPEASVSGNEPIMPKPVIPAEASEVPQTPTSPEISEADPNAATPTTQPHQPSIADYAAAELQEQKQGGGKKKILFIIMALILVFGLGVGGVFLYNTMATRQKQAQMDEKKKNAAAYKPNPTATPTPEALENLSQYTVQVLNGSGIAGEAAKASDLLKDAGFADIDIGNAQEYDYTDTEVLLKKGAPEALFNAVKKALESDYSVTQSANELTADNDWDIQVIVGTSGPADSDEPTPTEEEN